MLRPYLSLPLHAGSMKAKDLTTFLNKYALAKPVKEREAGAKSDAEKPHAKTDNKEDADEKALPQVRSQATLSLSLSCSACCISMWGAANKSVSRGPVWPPHEY